jgi:adenylate cyclase
MSETPDSTLAAPQQIIADLRRTNCELQRRLDEALAERDEALEQQTATAEVLQVINSSPGDLGPVFDAMLEKAVRLCDAAFGILWMYDGDRFHAARLRDVTPAFAEFLREPMRPVPGGTFSRLLAGEPIAEAVDITGSESYRAGTSQLRRAFFDLGGAQTALFVALRKDQALLGAFTIYRKEIRPFTGKQTALVTSFAAQAVIAMENARLITETREALEQQTATAEVLQVINASPGHLAPVFEAILEKAHNLCGVEYGALQLYDGEKFRAVATRGYPEKLEELLRHPYSLEPTSPVRALLHGEPLVEIPDVIAHQAEAPNPRTEAAIAVGIRSALFLPLRRDNLLLGTITAGRKEARPFLGKEIALLQNFAAQAVIAMENARLLGELRQGTEELTRREAALRNSEERYALAMRAINEGVYEWDVATSEMYYSPRVCELVGLQASELRTMTDWTDRIHPDDRQPFKKAILAHFKGETDRLEAEYRYRHADGSWHWARQNGIALKNEAGRANRVVGSTGDITDRKAAEEALREALEQQTATAEVLQVINSSPGDLTPVFDAMLAKAIRLCEATHGHLFNYDGECFHLAAVSDEPRYVEWVRQVGAVRPRADAPLGRISRGERIVHIADMREEEIYQTVPTFREQVELRGVRSQITVGLLKDTTLLGAMVIYRQEVRPFTDKQIALLENFAAQAVIAMENARLLDELRQRTDQVAELNRGLEAQVAEQVEELGRVGRLKRFLAPQLAELIVSQGDEKILESHRREIVVVFCDLRGYTAFTETAEPEEVLDFLREYHGALGPLVSQFEGTLDQFSGDGIMVFFNDPVPCPDPAERAVKMAMAMRDAAGGLIADWRERGRELGFGAGIAQGYATLGQIGFSERSGYTAIGTVCNVAARLCAEAKDGQILLSQRVNVALKGGVATEQLGPLALKGLTQPIVAYNVPLAAIQPALRVIEGGPQSV